MFHIIFYHKHCHLKVKQSEELLSFKKHCQENDKKSQSNGRKWLQVIYLIKDMCPEYIKNSQNSVRSNTIKNGQKKLADISQRNTDGTWAHEKMFDTYSLWKMQIKTAVRYNYLPIRRTVLTRMWNNWHSHKLLVELQSVGPLWKTLWQFLTYTYMWSSNSTSRYLPKWNENLWSHKIVMSNFTPQPRNNPNQLKNG